MTTSQISLKITADPSGVEQGIGRAKRSLADFKSSGEQSLGGIGQAASLLQGKLAVIGGGLSVGLAVGQLVQVQREFDALNSSLVTVAGGSAAAAKEMDWLKQFAKDTPFGLAQATSGFVKMKALGLDPTRAALTSFGNTAAAMGKDLNQMIEAVADASTGEFERLKAFGIKAKKEGDQVKLTFQGVTTSVGNNAAEITKYLEGLGNIQFAGAMEVRAKTLDGAIASLGDTWDELFRTVSSQGVGDVILDSVRAAEASISDLTTIIRALNDVAGQNAGAVSTMAAAQEVLATAFEAVAVLGVNVAYTLKTVGKELAVVGAVYAQVSRLNWEGAKEIAREHHEESDRARKAVDALSDRILNARRNAAQIAALSSPNSYDEPATLRAVASGEKAIADAKAAATKAARDAQAAEAARIAAAKEASKEAKKAAEDELQWRRKFTLEMVKAWDDEADAARKAYDVARVGALKLAEATEAAQANATAGLADKLAAMRDEIEMIGLTAAAQTELTAVKAEQVIADKEIELIMLQNADASAVQIQLLEQEIKLRKQLVVAMRDKAGKEAAADADKAAASEWERASQQIEQSLTDALMRGFESGKGFAEVLRDTVANMFKTLVLRPVISAVVNPVAGAITGSLGLSGAANAGTSALSSLGAIGSFTGAFGAGGAAGFGALMGGGFTEAVSAGFTTLLTGGSVGTAAAGLGTLAGALGPIALGLGALSSLIGRTKGESRWGGQYGFNFGDGLINNRRGTEVENAVLGVNRLEGANTFAEAEVQAAISGTVGSINNLLKAAGSSAALVGFQAGLETSGKGRGGVFAGGKLSTGATFGESGQGDNYLGTLFEKTSTQSPDAETALKNFALDLQQATIQALQAATDIPESIAKLVQGVDAESLTAEAAAALLQTVDAQVAGVNQLRAAFDAMGLPELAGMGYDTAAALAQAAGGFEALGTNLSGFYQAYYSEAERTANTTAQLAKTMGDLGVEVPATKEAFRGLVEAALAAGDTQLASGLLQVSGAFASVADAASSAAQQMQSAWASILATRDQGAADAFNVQNLFAQYKATDKYGITDPTAFLTIAQEDFAANYTAEQQKIIAAIVQALNKGVTSAAPTAPTPYGNSYEPAPETTALQEAIDQITAGLLDARGSLEIELLRAQGKDTEALAALRAQETEGYTAAQLALYDYNQTLRDQIDALQAAKAVADERMGLERQYLQLTGATSVLRALELAALDASNRALQERIWAIQDARQATDSAYAALERAVAKQRETLNTQRTAAQSLVQDISGVFDTLKSNVASLFGQVESTAQFQASQGRSFITDALTAARAGTGLPDGGDLSDAIAAARGGLDAAVYASQAEADFQRLVLANELQDLQDISGTQKSIAEQQLKAAEDALNALDGTLQAARDQIDALRGVDTSVKTVEEAVRAVEAAIRAEVAAGGAGASGGGLVSSGGNLTASGNAALVANTFKNAFGRDPKAEGLAYWTATGLSGNELVTAIINAGIANGEKIIPGFASGGYHTGGLRVVGENGPELEATGPSRIWNAQQMQQLFSGGSGSSNNERLFNAMLVRLESIEQRMAENNQHARRTAEVLDNVTEGGNNMRSVTV